VIKLGVNETGLEQTFYLKSGNPLTLQDKVAGDFTERQGGVPSGFRPVKNFLEFLTDQHVNRFFIQRSFALGDTLMLIPVIRWLRSYGWDCYARVMAEYVPIFEKMGVPAMTTRASNKDYGLLTDWIVERDMSDPDLAKMHRTHIYLKAAGVNDEVRWEDLDWSCRIENFEAQPDEFLDDSYIVFQGQGANKRKQLSQVTIENIIASFNARGVRIYYLGEPEQLNIDMKMNKVWRSTASLSHMFHIIARASAMVAVDSGPMWMSHFTSTPVVAILGPSHWRQRLSMHPLWPEGAKAIQMNEWMGCESCHEAAEACGGSIACLHKNEDKLIEALMNKALIYF